MPDLQLTCLFLAPPTETSGRIFDELLKISLHLDGEVLFASLDSAGRYGELISSVAESLYRSLEKADLIIADISDGNPNVMYELGFAHGLKKPVLPLVRRGTGQIPSDLGGYIYFSYDPDDLGKLQRVVIRWIQENKNRKKEVEKWLSDHFAS